ncbi:MAG TPA: hypothetical protein VNO32_65880 [Candidatus Acidoferrum sp.]|nr:hypothetical protein [Candidatus Acidoferrum sp.]
MSAKIVTKGNLGTAGAVQTRWLADLTLDIISPVATAVATRTSPLAFINIHHFHGLGTHVAPDVTAFSQRRTRFMTEIVAVWEPGSKTESAVHRQ